MEQYGWLLWIAAMVLFGILEAATVNMVSVWFVGGSLAALVVQLLGGNHWLQLAAFLVVSGILLAALRPFVRKFVSPNRIATNADMAIGREAYLTETVDNLRGTGALKLDGKEWTVRSTEAIILEKGTLVAVYDLDGDAFAYYSYSDKTISLNSKISTFRVDQKKKALDFTLCDDPRIAVIDSYPCNNYPYDLNKISAIIIRPYHSATLNTSGENFINFCREVAIKGIPMFLTNARSGSVYASSLSFKTNKIIELVGSTFPSVYIKLWIALSEGKDIVEFMQSPICDEFHK